MYDGNNKVNTLSDIIGNKGYAVAFENLIDYINDKALNKSSRELINHLAYLYRLDPLVMADIAKVSINEKGLIDKLNTTINTIIYNYKI